MVLAVGETEVEEAVVDDAASVGVDGDAYGDSYGLRRTF
jgi:hypothetical protein